MPDPKEVLRLRPSGDPERVHEQLRDWNTPVVFEEADRAIISELVDKWTISYFRDLAGDLELSVRFYPPGHTDPASQVLTGVTLSDFLIRISDPERYENYSVRLTGTDPRHRARAPEVFDDLARVSRELASLASKGLELDTLWLAGPATVTPMHYDPVSRLHGVITGSKTFHLFPADMAHLRYLEVLPARTPLRNYSSIGLGPLDSARFPGLERAKRTEAVLGPGDVLYIPPCWWHYVTVSEPMTLTASIAYTQAEMYRQWAFWRLRLGKLFGSKQGI